MTLLETLWAEGKFTPNAQQRAAIEHVHGPLYLPAGPGSGKTRVLLWRTVNLIVNHGVKPGEVFLATFTEKAANQLREGLRGLLGQVSNKTQNHYDLSDMYVGTVHSLCRRLATDRAFSPNRARGKAPILLDELSQYFQVYDRANWHELLAAAGLDPDAEDIMRRLNGALGNSDKTSSRHKAASSAISFFNRLSEECLDPAVMLAGEPDEMRQALVKMYAVYRQRLANGQARRVDFSLLQQEAVQLLAQSDHAGHIFKHVIVDEYQDTNTVQEQIYFMLAAGHKNLCVVGDDDQAMYRFRGATVENFVDFPQRCLANLGWTPIEIPLVTNYRSRKAIVDVYTQFMDGCAWQHAHDANRHYRVISKKIVAHSSDGGPAVVASDPDKPVEVAAEIAGLVRALLDEGRVSDPSQIAFLFPSLKYEGKMNENVSRMKMALEAVGLRVYAPRAGRFIEVPEATAMLGLMLAVLGRPESDELRGNDAKAFSEWLDTAEASATQLMEEDTRLRAFVQDRKAEIKRTLHDHQALIDVAHAQSWDLDLPQDFVTARNALAKAGDLSPGTLRVLTSRQLENAVRRRERENTPYALRALITRLTSLDWHVLDLFYRFCGFQHFIEMFDLAEFGGPDGRRDEGPICNLGLLSNYLARFLDERGGALITGASLASKGFQARFFSSYIFTLFRRGESEYEDVDDPFPAGRIPFLTIHQSKGLEFPVVVLGNLRKDDKGPQHIEQLVNAHLPPSEAREPLERMTEFDIMRLFYVALSRAQNLLVLAHFKGQGQRIHPIFNGMLNSQFPRIDSLQVASVPKVGIKREDIPKNYSYTSDYLFYNTCPRRYMVFRRYGFAPSTTQTMMFGSLVHRTLEDLHQMLIHERTSK